MKDSFWLFDTGEGTQVQLQRCMVRPALVDKIFVTHAHGDHTFGLPGLLCLIARGRKQDAPPLEIYGMSRHTGLQPQPGRPQAGLLLTRVSLASNRACRSALLPARRPRLHRDQVPPALRRP